MELRDYLRVLRKQWRVIALITLLAVGAAALVTSRSTPQYQASTKFFVSVPSEDTSSAYTGGLFSQQRVKSYVDVLAGPTTADAVARDVPGLDARELQGKITASAVPDTVLLNATVTDTSPQRALALADAIAKRFPDIVLDLERRADGGMSPISARVTERPQLPTAPVSPRPMRNLALALILGLLLGVGLAVLRETLDNTIKHPDDVREATGASTMGAITFDPGAPKRPLIVHDTPRAPRAEAFRQLRTNLQFLRPGQPLKSFVITSSVPREGKSSTACNLALTLAQAGVHVVLVEGDLRRPKISDYLGIEGAAGLTTVLIGQADLDDVLQPWGDGHLQVLPSGPIPPNPSELLASTAMQAVLDRLTESFDVVIIDAPPLLPVTDGAILARMTDGALLTVHVGETRKEQLHRAAQSLEVVDATLLGVVLNMVPRRGPDAGYSYGYGYGSYTAYGSDLDKPQMAMSDAAQAVTQRRGQPVAPTPAQAAPDLTESEQAAPPAAENADPPVVAGTEPPAALPAAPAYPPPHPQPAAVPDRGPLG